MRFDKDFVANLVQELIGDETIFSVDAVQYDWDGHHRVHLATRLARQRRDVENSVELVPGLFINQHVAANPTVAFTASAANMMVRRWMFESLGGFDERIPMGYEDVDLCWRAWLRGWKTLFVPGAICWHRVGGSSVSVEGSRWRFRGNLAGRLLLASKLLPLRYAVVTWTGMIAGIAKDLVTIRLDRCRDRTRVVWDYVSYLPGLLRERGTLYNGAGVTPARQLERLFRLGDR